MEASTVPAAGAESRSRIRRVVKWAWRAIRPDVPFYVLASGFVLTGVLASQFFGYPRRPSFHASWQPMVLRTATYAIPAFVAALCWAVLRRRRTLKKADTWAETARAFFEPRSSLRFLLLAFALPPFMNTFVAFKAAIPDVNPFSRDVAFMELDRVLHLGHDPWILLDGILGSAPATIAVDAVYISWFSVLALTVIWQGWHGDHFSDARARFLLAFAGCWIVIGVAFATLLSSAGPVYYEAVVGEPGPYGALLERLHAVDGTFPLQAVGIQETLWASYAEPATGGAAEGISAMPSMHVSMAVLLTLVGFRVNRVVGWAYAAYTAAILVGSVHLAWHYAVDGYLAALLTVGIWWASGRVVSRWQRRADCPGTVG